MSRLRAPERRLHDAVIIVPGIMGSALKDVESGKQLWGIGRLFEYTARMHAGRLRALGLTEAERAGRTGRIEPTGVLNVAEWMPGFGSAQPYNELVSELRRAAVHRSAVLPFPYDWRLSVEHNGGLLAGQARRHLEAWRQHAAHRHYLDRHPEAGPARLVFVAHSMGGLLVRELVHSGGLRPDIRAVMTVGTPFSGSVNAAVMLNSGKGAPLPLPRTVLRDAARTMPGVYDLLPSYRALDLGTDSRVPTAADLVALGGRRDLVEDSLRRRDGRAGITLPEHSMVVGLGKRTLQSYHMAGDTAVGMEAILDRDPGDHRVLFHPDGRPRRENRKGDGTVYQFAAHLPGAGERPVPVYQEHGALARSRTVIDHACGMLRGLRHPDELGAMLGDGTFDLDAPEWVEPGAPFTIEVSGWDGDFGLSCTAKEVSGLGDVLYPELKPVPGEDGRLAATCVATQPGLYEFEVVGGKEPVTRLVLVLAAERQA
ncbi:esterase/lipase family protein [Streptomyces sp. NPDC059989]|uniref:esterase/lipase family protein n=1 Tax=Streptomyces sp. NPDC059989 TaxID=3347026 RepID=UPI003683FEE4